MATYTVGFTIFHDGAAIKTHDTIEAAREHLLRRLGLHDADALRPHAFWPLHGSAHIERYDFDPDAPDARRATYTRVETLMERAR